MVLYFDSNLNGCTIHAMFSWPFNAYCNGRDVTMSERMLSELREFYADVEIFIIDEVNAMSAEDLARLNETMTKIFNPLLKKVTTTYIV